MKPGIFRPLLFAGLVGACHGSVAEDLQGFLQVRSFLSQRNEQQYRIATANGIDEARYVPVGGSEQYISIRGEDRANPLILFLHGGPGDATGHFAVFMRSDEFLRELVARVRPLAL